MVHTIFDDIAQAAREWLDTANNEALATVLVDTARIERVSDVESVERAPWDNGIIVLLVNGAELAIHTQTGFINRC